jgi:hypothetical protein
MDESLLKYSGKGAAIPASAYFFGKFIESYQATLFSQIMFLSTFVLVLFFVLLIMYNEHRRTEEGKTERIRMQCDTRRRIREMELEAEDTIFSTLKID